MEPNTTQQASDAAAVATPAPADNAGATLPPPSAYSAKDAGRFIDLDILPEAPPPEATPPAEVPPVIEPVVTPPEVVPEEPPVEEPPTEPEPAPKERILPNRISTSQFKPEEQEAIALLPELKKADPTASLRDAFLVLDRRKAEANAPVLAPVVQPPGPTEIDTLTAELADVDAILNKAAEEDSRFTPELKAATAKQAQLTARLELAHERERQAQSAQDTAFATARAAARVEAETQYPDAGNPGTPLGREVAQTIAALKGNPAHPDHNLLYVANAPLVIAQNAAMKLAQAESRETGIPVAQALANLMAKPTVAAPVTPKAKPEPVKPAPVAPKAIPASGAAQVTPTPPEPDGSELLKGPWDPKAYSALLQKQQGGLRGILGVR